MAIARPLLGLTAMLLLAGGIVMQFLVVLSGLSPSPLNQIYFLEASTNGIVNGNGQLRNPARWTYLDICGVSANGRNADCTSTRAALPFDPVRNFGTTQGVPEYFQDHRNYFYYISRIGWAFYIIALFFAVVAFLLGLVALVSRLGSYLSSSIVFLAVGAQAIAAALMTAWVVRGRNHFRNNNLDAHVGVKAMAFSWSSFAAFFLASVFFCIGGTVGKNKNREKTSYFGRKRSTKSARSRGSFIDSGSERRVKDEYVTRYPDSD